MKLIGMSCSTIPRLPGVRAGDLVNIECAKPSEALKGWRISIRGQQVFLISPPGWVQGQNTRAARDPKGPVLVFEIPRADVAFQWQVTPGELDDIHKAVGKYDSEPFGPEPSAEPAPEKRAPVPAGQMGDA